MRVLTSVAEKRLQRGARRYRCAMETIDVDVPRRGVADDLVDALAAYGLEARLVEDDDRCVLEVAFAGSERDRLLDETAAALESWLADRRLPLVVQRADGGCVVRPPAD
jgi:hypothetical protein